MGKDLSRKNARTEMTGKVPDVKGTSKRAKGKRKTAKGDYGHPYPNVKKERGLEGIGGGGKGRKGQEIRTT